MLGGFHWWDLIPPLFIIVVVGGGLVALVRAFGRSIGEGYAREQHRQEQHPDQP